MHSLTAYSFRAQCGRSRKRFAFFVAASCCIALAGSLLGTGAGFRDRALIGVMVYSFARVGAGVTLRVEDYFEHGKRSWLRLHERREGSEVPCHHNFEAYLDAWIEAAGIAGDKKVRFARATN